MKKEFVMNPIRLSLHHLIYLSLADSDEHIARVWYFISDDTVIINDHTKNSAHLIFFTHKADSLASLGYFKTSPDVLYSLSAITAVIYKFIFHGCAKE